MKRYDPKVIEPKWQKIWADTKLYKSETKPGQPKQYVLDFFPYPSGAGLSVGHVRNYTMSDVYPRMKRMQGFNVLHPMGWDAFGLPAENYAIKNKVSPRVATDQNKANYKRQMQMVGLSYDWDREIDSTDPKYYRWTQWFFLLLYKRGLAYQADSLQWWCETDKTVLANEQVENGKCWRCGNPVTKKKLKQWFFKITDYADRLLEDLKGLDWPEGIKLQQRNWIGRSEGAEVDFELRGLKADKLTVFTTRPDTLAGATFVVVSPELAQSWAEAGWKAPEAVTKYIAKAFGESEIERQDEERPKTGVDTGIKAVNPLTSDELPVWVADYVLGGYGTGAIMAVPAHDQRDYDFAQKFDLPIKKVIEPKFTAESGDSAVKPELEFVKREAVVAVVRNPKTDEYLCISWKQFPMNGLVTGGVEDGEDPVEAAKREVREETGYKNLKLVQDPGLYIHSLFYHRQKKQNRWARFHFLFFELADEERDKVDAKEAALLDAVWKKKNELRQFFTVIEGSFIAGYLENPDSIYTGEGVLVNSGEFDGSDGIEAKRAIVEHLFKKQAGKGRTQYKLRDWLISRQRYWGAPIPIIHCPKCGAVPVPEDQLPVELPDIKDYEPSGDGRSPLARATDWVKTDCPKCGGPAERETDTMDGFACSSWYFLRFASPHYDQAAFDPEAVKYWLPVDLYIGGAEHAVMHLLYARFWTKVMQDASLIDFNEPFKSLRNQGMILAQDGRKMSKSLGNVITPDEVIEQGYGADALRLYEMFIAPYDQAVPWSQQGLTGTSRFLHRVWALVQDYEAAISGPATGGSASRSQAQLVRLQASRPLSPSAAELETVMARLVHKTIKKVTDDIGEFGFNTAVAALMECVNELYLLKTKLKFEDAPEAWRAVLQTLLMLLAPFAPHITEELWSDIGDSRSVHVQSWPKYDEGLVKDELVEVVVQVNGKMRAVITVPADISDAELQKLAASQPAVKKYLEDQKPKIIVVPRKLVNFVVK